MLAAGANDGHMRIVVGDLRAALLEEVEQHVAGRLAVVVYVRLVGQANDENLAAVEGFFLRVERLLQTMHHIHRHGGVHLAGQLDELGVLPILACLPREVEWINRDAMPAKTGAGIESHVAERFGLRGVDDFPHVNAHRGIDLLEFVHQRDVHAAEDVLEQLGRLGGTAGRDRHDGLDGLAVKLDRALQAGRRKAADDFGDLRNDAVGVTGIFALGGKGEVEVHARLHAVALEHGAQVLIRSAGISRGFEHHKQALVDVRQDGLAGLDDVADVGFAVFVERSRDADDDGVELLDGGEVRGRAEALGVDLLLNRRRRDVFDVALARIQRDDLPVINVEAGDLHAGAGELQG